MGGKHIAMKSVETAFKQKEKCVMMEIKTIVTVVTKIADYRSVVMEF